MLDLFCDNTESAQQQYLAFVADGLIGSGHRRTRGNACSEAKLLVAFFAFEPLGMTTKAIANYLGMSHQGASKTVARGRVISWSKGITLESLSR